MTPEREMEIRAYYAHEGEPPVSFYRPKEAGSAARYDMAEVLAALDAEREKAARLERERDELAAQLACDACDGSGVAVSGPCGCGGRGLPEMLRAVRVALHDVTRERDELAAQLAALHAAASAVQTRARALPVSMTEIVHAEEWDDLDRTIADAAPTAAKHKRRVRAKVIAEVLGLYDGTNGCAAADLTPVIEAAQSLETRIRADERVRALREAAERLREHAASIADAEARRVAAEMRAIQAEGRAERLERELAEARRGYDTVTAALEGGTGDPLASALRRAEKAERERDAARAQLAALREAAARYVHSLGEDEETHPTLGRVFVSRDDDGAEDALDEALAASAPDAEAYTRRVQADALESAADAMRADTSLPFDTRDGRDWLRARAAELRGGR